MIQLPHRSVTRFFIPLIDVLTLLFCVFLIMPVVHNTAENNAELRGKTTTEQIDYLVQKLKRLEEESHRKIQNLKERLVVRVLEIDGSDGRLYLRGPERREIKDGVEAREMIDLDRRASGQDGRDLYYLILYPRDRGSDFPTEGQRREYTRWFQGVALGFDVPSASGKGGP